MEVLPLPRNFSTQNLPNLPREGETIMLYVTNTSGADSEVYMFVGKYVRGSLSGFRNNRGLQVIQQFKLFENQASYPDLLNDAPNIHLGEVFRNNGKLGRFVPTRTHNIDIELLLANSPNHLTFQWAPITNLSLVSKNGIGLPSDIQKMITSYAGSRKRKRRRITTRSRLPKS